MELGDQDECGLRGFSTLDWEDGSFCLVLAKKRLSCGTHLLHVPRLKFWRDW